METPTEPVAYERIQLGPHPRPRRGGFRRRPDGLERSAHMPLSRGRVRGPMSIGESRYAFGLDAGTLHPVHAGRDRGRAPS